MSLGHETPQKFGTHIDASHSRQPLVKGERLVRYEVNAVIHAIVVAVIHLLYYLFYGPFLHLCFRALAEIAQWKPRQ